MLRAKPRGFHGAIECGAGKAGLRVSTEDFFDQVARTLAEPMPRRRAVRVLGASLVAMAVPGIRPARALARPESRAAACSHGTGSNPHQNVCDKILPDRTVETYCCGPPKWQYGCYDPVKGNCANSCPPRVNLGHRVAEQYPCTAARPDAQGVIRGQCCVKPEYKGCSPEGKCLPNCPYQHQLGLAAGPISCGERCCGPGQECVTWLSSNTSSPPKKTCARTCGRGERRCPPEPGHFPVCCATPCCDGDCCEDGEECTQAVLRSGATFKMCRPKCKAPEKRCDTDCCVDKKRFYRKNAKGKLMCRCLP